MDFEIYLKLNKDTELNILNNVMNSSSNNFTKELLSNYKIQPVILSGGKGTRLWPLSREDFPKQYLKLNEKSEFSLLQNTFQRIRDLKRLESPLIICNEGQRFIVAEQMRELNIEPKSIILEPSGKNTAPAIALSALLSNRAKHDHILLVLSSDHLIENTKKFLNVINEAIPYALEGRLVTFGIVPKSAETGYGYIESYDQLTKKCFASKIKSFIEKPKKEIAENLIKDKHYSWNSGIFLFKSSTILNELRRFQPELVELCEKSLQYSEIDFNFTRLDKKYFNKCKNLPIDTSIMEKTNLGTVLRFDGDWKDLGNWKSVWENSKKDQKGNSLIGRSLIKESSGCFLRSEHRLVVGLGLKDLMIIETDDSVLVANKDSTELIKQLVKDLEKYKFSEGKHNRKVYRPWGHYTSVIEGTSWQVKRLEINSNASISLQTHKYRSEHWVVVSGTATVELDGKTSNLYKNESTYIPNGCKHRLTNPGEVPLIVIEVQSGSYLGEDDILRFEDNYGRT